MKYSRLIYILGDVHGDFKTLNMFINLGLRRGFGLRKMAADSLAAGEDFQAFIIQCGDFAYYWPGFDSFKRINVQADFLPADSSRFTGSAETMRTGICWTSSDPALRK